VPLADALALLLLARDQQPGRFEGVAPRWHARLCSEAPLTLSDAHLALAALHALRGPSATAAGKTLIAICGAHGLIESVGLLDAWLRSQQDAPRQRMRPSQ
jgi:hypothetical protein